MENKQWPLIGAIRWDAWYPGNDVHGVVDPLLFTDYDYRKPYYGWYDTGIAEAKTLMDDQIHMASSAGLDYWAFVWYPEEGPEDTGTKLGMALRHYLYSQRQAELGFCLILQTSWVSSKRKERWRSEFVPQFVAMMKRPQYVRVNGNRPLVYWMDTALLADEAKGFGADWKTEMEYFKEQLALAGLDAPYLVDSRHDYIAAINFGLDAVSDYGPASIKLLGHYPYGVLARHDRGKRERPHPLDVVPGVSAAIDPRPRDNTKWMKAVKASYYGFSFETPTWSEWYRHLKDTCAWIRDHPEKTPNPGVICIYSWNEIDEGGPGMVPTLQEGTMFLDALKALKSGLLPGEVINRINDSDPIIRYHGGWVRHFPRRGCRNNDVTESGSPGDAFEVIFEGHACSLAVRKGPDCGIIEVEIDGTKLGDFDLYNSQENGMEEVHLATGLPSGEHRLSVRISDQHPRVIASPWI